MSTDTAPSFEIAAGLRALAKDLAQEPPRSPHETLAGYVIAPRTLDKCRAALNGTAGEYDFNGFMDKVFFDFTGISADAFSAFVATGASDEAVGEWIAQHARQTGREEVAKWNHAARALTPRDMPDRWQLYMEDYIPQCVPNGKIVRHIFDIFDFEEGRG